jgi:hypothetical protein
MNETYHRARWGGLLIGTSIFVTIFCLGSGVALFFLSHLPIWAATLPVLLVPAAALFVVRGYSVASDAILVRRSFWNTCLPRAGLSSVACEPNAMRGSLRTCGNGGAFSITGWYWNRRLGRYRAFVTDLRRTVVLRYGRRTVVVSPENPEEFVRDLGLDKN